MSVHPAFWQMPIYIHTAFLRRIGWKFPNRCRSLLPAPHPRFPRLYPPWLERSWEHEDPNVFVEIFAIYLVYVNREFVRLHHLIAVCLY